MPKTPAERAQEYRARKKLSKPQKPPAKTGAQRKREYRARQKALRNAVATSTNFVGSRELLTVNPDNPQPSTSTDDGNILYNYLSLTSGQAGQVQVPVILDFGANELKNKIKNIRSTYQQEVNEIRKSRQSFILEEYKTNLADRFLGSVINSAKNSKATLEEEDSSCFQPNECLNSLVKTEMINNDDVEPEAEERFEFERFNTSVDQIKEEIEEHVPPQHHQPKARKLSHDSNEANINRALEDYNKIKDEWFYFGNNISCQLRNLPLERALLCQKKIIEILTVERLDYVKKLNQ